MNDQRNEYGFPVLERVQAQAAEIRARNFPAPCDCAECVKAQNLPAVQRILARWTPLDKFLKDE